MTAKSKGTKAAEEQAAKPIIEEYSRKGTTATAMALAPELEPVVRGISALSPQNFELVKDMVRQLALREGYDMAAAKGRLLDSPAAGVPLWVSKLRQEGYSHETILTYSSTIRVLLESIPAPTGLDLQAWLAARLETCSTSTAATALKAMRSLFGFLFAEGLWHVDPTARLRGIKVVTPPKETPTVDEMQRLVAYRCRQREDADKFQMLTVLLATTGLRVSEGAGLRRDRVHLTRLELTIVGKGNKIGVVPLVPVTAGALCRYMAEHPTQSPFLFPSDSSRTGHWSRNCYEKTFRAACESMGMRHFTPHSLRHFYATFMLVGGAKLEVVSRILRHSSVGTTGDTYRHVLVGELHSEAGRFAPMADRTTALVVA